MTSDKKEIINIYPQTTSIEHSEDKDCWCEPKVEELKDCIKIHHFSIWGIMAIENMGRNND